MNPLFLSQFAHCPLAWIFHSRELNHKIKRLHERCLRVVYHETISSFKELLQKDNSVSVHLGSIQVLVTEMLRVYKSMFPKLMTKAFPLSQPYFSIRTVKSVYYGAEPLGFLGPNIWELVPAQLKNVESLEAFESSVKKWEPIECHCRHYKTYIQQVGFIQDINFILLYLVYCLCFFCSIG